MLSRFRNPRTDLEEMGRPSGMPVRHDNWGTSVPMQGPDTPGVNVVVSQDLIDITLPDDHAGPLVITLSGPEDGLTVPAANGAPTRTLLAQLDFGTGGARVIALCDWIRGERICIHAGRVRVAAQWNVVGALNAAPNSITVGAFAAFGTATGHRPAQLTDYIGGLRQLAAATVRVPSLARRLTMGGTPVNIPFNVDFLDPNGGVICNYVVGFYPGFSLPIPGGARWCTVTNGGNVDSQPRLFWELDL